MTKKTSLGLGRGLGALISDADFNPVMNAPAVNPDEIAKVGATEIKRIRLDQIDTNPYQPRQVFDESALEELADSIRQLGLIQPITVRSNGLRYQIISGERRFRAAGMAGLDSVPAYILNTDDRGMLEMAIVENIQRENLDAIEVAMSFQRLIEECNLTQEQMAERVGKKRTTVTNFLRLLKLPAEIQLLIRNGKVSMGHAKVLLSVEDPKLQKRLCEAVVSRDLSVRQLENRIKPKSQEKAVEEPDSTAPEQYFRLMDILGRFFDNNVSFKRSPEGKGTVSIQFREDSQVFAFLDRLEKSDL